MLVTFYNFQKRVNSTKIPAGGTSYDCALKDGSSITRPRIVIKWDGGSSAPRYNMAFISKYARYYWVDEWTFADRCWTASMHVDVLATAKPVITNTDKYVLRAAAEYDLDVIDTKYPAKAGVEYRQSFIGTGLDWGPTGSYVIGVSGALNTYSVAGTGYYVCTAAQLQQVLTACFNQTETEWNRTTTAAGFGEALNEFGQKWAKSVFNPFQFINSVLWLPFTPGTSGSATVKLGLIDTGITAGILNETTHESSASFSVNTNPGADKGAWRRMAPYCRYVLYFMPFGTFSLDSAALYGASSVDCTIKIDTVTGAATLLAHCNNGAPAPILVYTSAPVGVPIQISGYSQDYANMAHSAISAAGAAVSAAVTGNIAGLVSAVGSAVESIAPDNYSSGSTGGKAAITSNKYLSVYRYEPVDEDVVEHGRPLCKVKTLGSLPGYILCADGDLAIELSEPELLKIAEYLTGGFFYE